MPKPHVYRPGDQVRVVNPRWIRRVGYPVVWTEIEQEVREMPRVQDAWSTFVGISPGGFARSLDIPLDVVMAFAKQVVIERGFGGNTRSIYYDEPETDVPTGTLHYGYARGVGQVLEVYSKRVTYTGIRVPGHYWVDHEGEEQGHDPFIDDRKAHVLLRTPAGEIEACDVEPV